MILNSFNKTFINPKESFHKSLGKTYGLGRSSVLKIIKLSGICLNQKFVGLEKNKLDLVTKQVMREKLLVDQELKKNRAKNLERLIEIKTYRGLRKLKGYPVRGQRTHSNAKTSKKRKFF